MILPNGGLTVEVLRGLDWDWFYQTVDPLLRCCFRLIPPVSDWFRLFRLIPLDSDWFRPDPTWFRLVQTWFRLVQTWFRLDSDLIPVWFRLIPNSFRLYQQTTKSQWKILPPFTIHNVFESEQRIWAKPPTTYLQNKLKASSAAYK